MRGALPIEPRWRFHSRYAGKTREICAALLRRELGLR